MYKTLYHILSALQCRVSLKSNPQTNALPSCCCFINIFPFFFVLWILSFFAGSQFCWPCVCFLRAFVYYRYTTNWKIQQTDTHTHTLTRTYSQPHCTHEERYIHKWPKFSTCWLPYERVQMYLYLLRCICICSSICVYVRVPVCVCCVCVSVAISSCH